MEATENEFRMHKTPCRLLLIHISDRETISLKNDQISGRLFDEVNDTVDPGADPLIPCK